MMRGEGTLVGESCNLGLHVHRCRPVHGSFQNAMHALTALVS